MTTNTKETKLTFFNLMDNINKKKSIEWTEEVEAAYNPFMVNRGFSNFEDSVLVANELNQYPNLDKKLQFDFYYSILPKKARFAKWAKNDGQTKKEEMIIELFGVSIDVAKQYVLVYDSIGNDIWKKIEERLEKGGLKNGRK